MKLILKILFFVLAIFQTNTSEAKVIVVANVISETIISNAFYLEKSSAELQNVFSENDIANTSKSEGDLVSYRNLALLVKAVATNGVGSWVYGAFKTEAKWAGQLSKRGWTAEQITGAVTKGKSFNAVNMVNKANSATRYVHPTTGQSVVIDNVTKELLHVGGPGFKY